MTMPSSGMRVDEVSATYVEDGQVLPVLDNVSFDVANGDLVAIIGPSGCGKSTLLDVVAGLIEPDQGDIWFDGQRLPAADRLGKSAYMHQRDLLLPWRDALANAALALEVQHVARSDARNQARHAFHQFGLDGFERKYPAQLSGGMRQRVAFVRTMLGGQSVILLDEPFGSLDALTRMHAQDWLAEALAALQRTVIFVTHDIDEALLLADRVLVLSSRPGSVIESITISEPRPRDRLFLATEEGIRFRSTMLAELGVLDDIRPIS